MLSTLEFSGELWCSSGPGAWTFVTVSRKCGEQIRLMTSSGSGKRKAWGMIRVKVRLGETEWSTTLWPDKTSGSFVVPVKAAVRKREGVSLGDQVQVTLKLLDE